MDLNRKGFFISVFQMAEQGELSNLEQKDIIDALQSYGMSQISNQISTDPNNQQEINIQDKFKRIREGSRILLEQTESCIDTSLAMLKEYQANIEKILAEFGTLPEFAQIGDSIETIKLITSLDQDFYNLSQAQELTGVTRQTLKKHAEQELNGLKLFQIGKSLHLSREGIITYYRAKFKDHSLPF